MKTNYIGVVLYINEKKYNFVRRKSATHFPKTKKQKDTNRCINSRKTDKTAYIMSNDKG